MALCLTQMREKNKAYTSCNVKLVIFYNNLFIEKTQFLPLTYREKIEYGVLNGDGCRKKEPPK
ncbi:hypothetical protein HMPREF9372_3620 [Sporosarcina newyorkensis 2681]|uniref:Uncharacterized protein n=1 Tax=Sporosarcina newyorkensis 2681 TaxID=1027292 RepID=F9DXT9_9BACL|nr:hypothetical protein HMPREF9372_3620 [Sporosarcina newyorkensis 2681]